MLTNPDLTLRVYVYYKSAKNPMKKSDEIPKCLGETSRFREIMKKAEQILHERLGSRKIACVPLQQNNNESTMNHLARSRYIAVHSCSFMSHSKKADGRVNNRTAMNPDHSSIAFEEVALFFKSDWFKGTMKKVTPINLMDKNMVCASDPSNPFFSMEYRGFY